MDIGGNIDVSTPLLAAQRRPVSACRARRKTLEKTPFSRRNAKTNTKQRLHARFLTDPARFSRLFAIVEDEVARGEHEGAKSCAKGLLWLKRAMQFIVGLVRGVGRGQDTAAAVQDAYGSALRPYHGMFSYGAFQTAFRFLPTSQALLAAVCGAGADESAARADFSAFAGAFAPLLAEVDAWIESKGLNDPAKV